GIDVETGAPASSYGQSATRARQTVGIHVMGWKLEVVVVRVADIDRATAFYTRTLGVRLDADTQPTDATAVVHMPPPGPACSVVVVLKGVAPGADRGSSASLQLGVPEVEAARAQLAERGVDVTPVQILDPTRDGGKYVFFDDPDGNNWAIQEVRKYVGAELGS